MDNIDPDTGNSAQPRTDEAARLLDDIDKALSRLDRSGLAWPEQFHMKYQLPVTQAITTFARSQRQRSVRVASMPTTFVRTGSTLLCLILCGHAWGGSTDPGSVVSLAMRDAEVVAQELNRCSLWTEVDLQDVAKRRQITDVYVKLSRHSTDSVRAGIALYVESFPRSGMGRVEAGQKVYAFLRVFFKVPRHAAPTEIPQGVDISASPVSVDKVVDFLWPFTLDANGELTLTGFDSGFHSGPDLDQLRSFMVMESHFERRFSRSN